MALYFYVKNGLGTRTSGGGLTKQTGSFTALGAANVYTSVAAALADTTLGPVTGDYILASDLHSFSAATIAWAFANGIYLISVSDTACDTPSIGATETETTTGSFMVIDGDHYMSGFTLVADKGVQMFSSTGANEYAYHVDCSYQANTTGTTGLPLNIGANAAYAKEVMLINPTFIFGGTGQYVQLNYDTKCTVRGGSVSGSGSIPSTQLFALNASGRATTLDIDGFDATNIGSACAMVKVANTSPVTVTLSNIKVSTAWLSSGLLVETTPPYGVRVEMYNYGDGTTTRRLWIQDHNGSIQDIDSIYLNAGVSDGTNHWSYKITTNANANKATGGLLTPDIGTLYSTTGTKTPVIELVSSDASLTSADVAMQSESLQNATVPIGTFQTTAPNPLVGGTGLPAGTGIANWTGATGLNSFKLTDNLAVAQKGYAPMRLVINKASTTLYYNPKAA